MRLNLFIAKSGIASRRQADELIKNGKIKINSKVILEPFYSVKEDDRITCKGANLTINEHVYIILNKPEGVTTTVADPFAEKKVIDLLPPKIKINNTVIESKSIYPVGRLDKNSTGLLILTNDGDLCHKLTHPKFAIEKEYLVNLKGELKEDHCQRLKKGVRSEGEFLKAKVIKVISRNNRMTLCSVVVTEGKKRHIRRMFKALSFTVKDLNRVRIGGLKLGNLKKGNFKIIMKTDILRILGL